MGMSPGAIGTPTPTPDPAGLGTFQFGGFYRSLTHSTLWTPVERGKVNPNSQAIVGPANMLLSGENAEHFRSQSQTAYSVETSEFLKGLVFNARHCVDSPWRKLGRRACHLRREARFLNGLLKAECF